MFTLRNSTLCASIVMGALFAIAAGNFDGLVKAQTTKATISGTVTDEKGAVVANAKIIAKNLDTNFSRETTSDGAGRYRIPELAAGQYEVTTEARGFRPKIHRGIELTVGREVIVDLLLNVGNVQDKVVIEGDASLVETTTSAVKYLVNRKQVEELPLNGRDVLQLATLQNGVVSAASISDTQENIGPGMTRLIVNGALPKSQATGGLTFNKDIASLLFKNCAECHRPGETAPFSALTYKDVRPWVKAIREKVLTREMPPWHADPHTGQWANDRRLAQKEIETIVAWVDQGATEGDPRDLPPRPEFVEGWTIGKPDLVLTMPEEFTLEASGPDEYRYFQIDPKFTEDKYVQMVEARPGNRKIVHHIAAFIQSPPKDVKSSPKPARKEGEKTNEESVRYNDGFLRRTKMDAPVHDDGCSLPNGGQGDRRDGAGDEGDVMYLAGYAPGMNQTMLGPGVIKKIPAGSRITLQVHYSKTAGSAQKDRSSVGLIFAKTSGGKEVLTRSVANGYFLIPPGAGRHRTTACWTSKEDIHIVTLLPHMHFRGVEMDFKAIYPDGRAEVLLNVPNYSFSWQTVYYAAKPIPIPKGTKIVVTAYFDNSSKNKYNPDPTRAVRFGDPTYDEMMVGLVEYTVDAKPMKASTAMN